MPESASKSSVLFVCMGNICRSPTAEGVFRKVVTDAGLLDRIHIESAGTHAYHVGHPPDRRAQAAANRRGVVLQNIRAKRVRDEDFETFDYILAMDRDNLGELVARAPRAFSDRLHLFLEFAGAGRMQEVPDPYYGGPSGFELVLDLVEDASKGLLERIRADRF
jgi:protein-tyrosine phosphatase